jgi:hypothetical protein
MQQCAGKRRRHSKKHGRKTRKHRGGYYGAVGAIAPGAMQWGTGSEMGDWAVSSRGGNAQYGSGRKRKGRKTRKHRGGMRFGVASASFQGSGSRGLADYVATNTKTPTFGGPAGGAFNNAGAQPGSGYGSFVKAA